MAYPADEAVAVAAAQVEQPSRELDIIAELTAAADALDRRRFSDLLDTVDWATRSPSELETVIKQAIMLDIVFPALDLIKLGVAQFPEYEPLQRLWRVFVAPPKKTRQGRFPGPPLKGIRESYAWLNQHAHEYRGQWVAVNQGQLVAVAPTLEEVKTLASQHEDAPSTLFLWVLP